MIGAALLAAALASPPAPPHLTGTGLYSAGRLEVAAGNLPYAPQYPLWSDGAEKSRWVRIPAGTTIDVSVVDEWRFPVGTKFWKEFRFAGRKVETRLLWRATARSWVYASYVWNEDQTEASLAPPDGEPGIVEIAPGRYHSIPSVADCRSCHENGGSPVLGFASLQLSDSRDSLAPHAEPLRDGMVTLAALADRHLIAPAGAHAAPPLIRAATPDGRAALGYLASNCGNCHRADGPLAPLGLDLRQAVWPGGSAQPPWTGQGRWAIPGRPGEKRWIAPGDPESSTVLARMSSSHAVSRMPPVGSVLVDEEAVALLRRWIAAGAEAASGRPVTDR